MKKYDIIAFDLDGTLTDPAHGLILSFEYGLKKMGVDFGPKESLKRFIGPPLYDEWRAEFGFSPEEAAEALRLFREYFAVYGWWDNEMYGGVPEMLARLKAAGKRIALATSKPEVFARQILNLFGLTEYFDFIGGASTDKTRDKKWEVLEYVLLGLGSPARERVILVGDRKYDAEGARKVGIASMGVTYGHGSEEEIAASGFDLVADSVSEIADKLI